MRQPSHASAIVTANIAVHVSVSSYCVKLHIDCVQKLRVVLTAGVSYCVTDVNR